MYVPPTNSFPRPYHGIVMFLPNLYQAPGPRFPKHIQQKHAAIVGSTWSSDSDVAKGHVYWVSEDGSHIISHDPYSHPLTGASLAPFLTHYRRSHSLSICFAFSLKFTLLTNILTFPLILLLWPLSSASSPHCTWRVMWTVLIAINQSICAPTPFSAYFVCLFPQILTTPLTLVVDNVCALLLHLGGRHCTAYRYREGLKSHLWARFNLLRP